jgi:protein involved in polysaccharide export with SLBB domain
MRARPVSPPFQRSLDVLLTQTLMFKISSFVLAVALAATAMSASAQEASRSDSFGQADSAPAMQSGLKSPSQSRSVVITNGSPDRSMEEGASVLDRNPSRNRTSDLTGAANGSLNRAGKSQKDRDARERTFDRSAARWDEEEHSNVQSEFQKFIFENIGEDLPIFGSEFFANAPSTFAPILNSPVPSDYLLGPGDELLIRGWGTIDIDYRATIDRNGTISIPSIGSVVLAGVKAGEAEGLIRSTIAKLYKGVTVNVTFGQLRALTVYVVGQASRPGTYTVSSMSTLVTALFASGGPNAHGSMRHVQVKRAGKVAAELDLYAFIGKGDKSADIKLLDGDTIYIPPAGGFVALTGKVNTPAIYELKSGTDTITSMLDFAGGLPVVADPRRAFLERIDANKNHPRSVEEFALDANGLQRQMKSGDVLNITAITPDFSNAVILRGNVDQPIRAPFKPGMRVSDLIPSRDYLITRSAIKRQNNVMVDDGKKSGEKQKDIAGQIGGLVDEINWDYAVIERVNRNDISVKLIPFHLGNVFSNPNGPDNVELQPGDRVTIFSQQDVAVPMDKRLIFVRVGGEVKIPGVYQMTAADTLQTLLAKAGGPTSNAYLFGTEFYREEVRKEQEANLEKAARKLESQMESEQSKAAANLGASSGAEAQAAVAQRQASLQIEKETIARFRQLKPTGRIAFGLAPSERSFDRIPQIKLENGDRLIIPAKPVFVHVFGSVNSEASPLWRPNTTVKDYLDLAGLSVDADVANTFIMRVDGTVVSNSSRGWFSSGISGVEVMPGDSIIVPEKFDKETAWTKFTKGTREWAQIFANFGLGAAAIKTLK